MKQKFQLGDTVTYRNDLDSLRYPPFFFTNKLIGSEVKLKVFDIRRNESGKLKYRVVSLKKYNGIKVAFSDYADAFVKAKKK
jgi:hypothetical protein